MKIAVDCRYIGMSGIGRVLEGILGELDYDSNEFYLIGKNSDLEKYNRAHIIADDTAPYSVKGLFSFPKQLNPKCDLLLVPNFMIPFGVKIPTVTVMHDLAFLDVKETTRGVLDRMVKKYFLKRCMKKSRQISCVSEFTRQRCKYYYHRYAEKCFVNYIGVSENVIAYAKEHAKPEKSEDIVFVGNIKAHKGLTTLLAAFSRLKNGSVLKIIGNRDHFLTGMSLDERDYPNVVFTGKLTDEELFAEIQRAKYLVLPSKYEGFGLPPLEALCLGTQPIVSDIAVFREVYSNLPVSYFTDVQDLAEKMAAAPCEIDCLETISGRYCYARCYQTLMEHIYDKIESKE